MVLLCRACRAAAAGSSATTAPSRPPAKAGPSCTRAASPTTTRACRRRQASGTSPCPSWIPEPPGDGPRHQQQLIQTKQGNTHPELSITRLHQSCTVGRPPGGNRHRGALGGSDEFSVGGHVLVVPDEARCAGSCLVWSVCCGTKMQKIPLCLRLDCSQEVTRSPAPI